MVPGFLARRFKTVLPFLGQPTDDVRNLFIMIRQCKTYAKRHLGEMAFLSPLLIAKRGQTKWWHSRFLFTAFKIIFANER